MNSPASCTPSGDGDEKKYQEDEEEKMLGMKQETIFEEVEDYKAVLNIFNDSDDLDVMMDKMENYLDQTLAKDKFIVRIMLRNENNKQSVKLRR
jgi:hypothetical protein